MRIQSLAVIVQLTDDTGEVELQYQIAVAVVRRMLSNVEVTEQRVKLILGTHVIVVL